MGRLERIELSIPAPQAGVLPLNYSRHAFLTRTHTIFYNTNIEKLVFRRLFSDAREVIREARERE